MRWGISASTFRWRHGKQRCDTRSGGAQVLRRTAHRIVQRDRAGRDRDAVYAARAQLPLRREIDAAAERDHRHARIARERGDAVHHLAVQRLRVDAAFAGEAPARAAQRTCP